jgi:hypothetical protein
MKKTTSLLMAAALLSGCATSTFEADNNARVKLTRQMSPDWLKSNIVLDKTTQPEVHGFFGEPLFKNLSTGSSVDTNSVPLEMWTYQGAWDKKVNQPCKFIVFSFTNDIIVGYHVSQNLY